MHRNRTKVQVTLELLPGSEPWILVRHPTGWFKCPASVQAGILLAGALERWQGGKRDPLLGKTWVLVRADLLNEVTRGDGSRRSPRTDPDAVAES